MKKLFPILILLLCFSQTAFTPANYAAFFRGKVPASGGGGSTAFVRKQFKHGYVATSVTLDTSVAVGDCIIVAVSSSSVAASGATDTLGNTYTLITSQSGSGGFISVLVAFSTSSGADTITETGATGDIGLTATVYSGPTSVDKFGSGSGANPSVSLTTTGTTMFFAAYENEASDSYTSAALNPGAVAATVIQHDSTHIDAQAEWLNSAAGYPAGIYTVDLTGTGGWVSIALK
jgi:hypothetical protein